MSIENTALTYEDLTTRLALNEIGLTGAEMHGFISGMLCGGSKDAGWLTMLYDLNNEGLAFPKALKDQVVQLHDESKQALEGHDFDFSLLLPDSEDSELFLCVEALSGWVNHFLLGLGLMQTQLDKVTGDVGEAIDDLRSIAQLGYDEEDDQEELAQALEEVSEYVRVVALMCHNEFAREAIPTSIDIPESLKGTPEDVRLH